MRRRFLPLYVFLAVVLATFFLGEATVAQRPSDTPIHEPRPFHKPAIQLAPQMPTSGDASWRKEQLNSVQSRVLDFVGDDPAPIADVFDALSWCRELEDSLVLYYKLPKEEQDALVSFLVASGCCQATKIAVQEGSVRIVARAEVHYSLIRLLQTQRRV